MQTKLVEVTQDREKGFNWGKFLLGRFDTAEQAYQSKIDVGRALLSARGWSPDHLLVLDLETGEGCLFRPGGLASADLEKHKVWVCPMFEPFLEWLYRQDLTDLNTLPDVVELPTAPGAMTGYRRPGPKRARPQR
jgi:hypothetical protein